ncbi:EAL domain-containing protein [Vibrio alginolyticus]|uniref:two-component system response regulator n=1 Tax=Vibrio alginolyticus TaxID=663 RepID=UPI001BD534B6|nr:GGDEF domain-containing response regulator [Vibrio alginolyticus]MBS9998981.1 EAL domain-containing protein [Vibrio alginolyticus]
MKVLIIDDDTIDRLAIKKTLRSTDLPISIIEEAQTAHEGLDKALKQSFDMILLDYQLPPSTGMEVLIALKSNSDFSTSIVMLSHSNDEELALKCIEMGAQDFVMKNEISSIRLRRAIIIATERYFLEQKVLETHTQLKQLAETDTLTGVFNRHFFDERLKKFLLMASRSQAPLALLLIDVDRFKDINDQYGHVTGDHVLQEVAQRLQSNTRDSDSLFRIGGDEFAVIATNFTSEGQVDLIVRRILSAFESNFNIDQQCIEVSISIGVASYPECASNSLELRKCSDIALYRAKEKGRKQAQYYSKAFHDTVDQRLRIESNLKQAIQKEEFELHYQPQFDKSMRLVGAEALIRWYHPDLGFVPPDVFIPIAEESGLIENIGEWVIETAIRQMSIWRTACFFPESFTLAVNLSPKQLSAPQLVERVAAFLHLYGVGASHIEFEITENCLLPKGNASKTLNELSRLGIQIAIDDFGTGYSSLSHLKYFPIDIIKIDRSFLKDIEVHTSRQLFEAICAFARSLNYEIIAEGIETPEQHRACNSMNVSRVQGFKYSKPLTVESFEKRYLLKVWREGVGKEIRTVSFGHRVK